jgi:hypothetical protein
LLLILSFLAAGARSSRAQATTVADLQPGLRDALVRTAACGDKTIVPVADSDLKDFLQLAVKTQPIHNSSGAEAGTIVTPTDPCHCVNQNCRTYIFLKSGETYDLALADSFALLRPMKVLKKGLPSLTGKFQVSPSEAESTIYDWDGTRYRATLCATVTQGEGRARPTIAPHVCENAPRTKSPQ